MTVKPAMRHTDAARVNRRPRRRRSPGRPAASGLSVGADAIVLKACELLREVAPRELSMVKLARHANVDRSLIRYYFTDRSGLLLAAARHLFGVLRGRLDAVERRLSGDPETRVREMAVKVSARRRIEEAQPSLLDLRQDSVDRVRAAAMKALST